MSQQQREQALLARRVAAVVGLMVAKGGGLLGTRLGHNFGQSCHTKGGFKHPLLQ